MSPIAAPFAAGIGIFLLAELPASRGVMGRVARTGAPAVINDTTLDPDYLVRDPSTDPRPELTIPIRVEHKMTVKDAKLEVEAEGYTLAKVDERLPRQHIIIFGKR